MKKKISVYVASPYGHDDRHVILKRYGQTSSATARIIEKCPQFFPYSPIVNSHHLQRFLSKPKTFDWVEYDLAGLHFFDIMLVLMLDEWKTSAGVAREIKKAEELEMPILYSKYLEVEKVLAEYLKSLPVDEGFPEEW